MPKTNHPERPGKDPSDMRHNDHGAAPGNLEIELRSLEAILLQKPDDPETTSTDSDGRAEHKPTV